MKRNEYEGFVKRKKKTYYYCNGKPVTKTWITTANGKRYYFDANGVMMTGTLRTGKRIYYFGDGIYSHNISLEKKMIALTYDDGPSENMPLIVNELKKVGGRATFFVAGNRVESYKKELKAACDAGCEIGNHSWDHSNLSKLGVFDIRTQISRTNAAIKKATSVKPVVLRPPYGYYSEKMRLFAGMPLVIWDVDTLDWFNKNPSWIIACVKTYSEDGSIILMHETSESTVIASRTIIPWLAGQGYQLVTLSELADARGGIKKGIIYHSFRK